MPSRFLFLLLLMIFIPTNIQQAQSENTSFLEATVDNLRPYVGQPITYTVRIFNAGNLEDAANEPPNFIGFGRVAETNNASTETINGIPYTVTSQQITLLPLRAGDSTITPYRLSISETPFQSAAIIESQAIAISVQALPDNPPDSFRNAIGQFDVTAAVDKRKINVGEVITLTVNITGTGNIEQILAPILPLLAQWRVVEETPNYQQTNPLFGTVTFRWSIMPLSGNPTEIPSIAFSFFNPQLGTYETRQTPPIPIEVVGNLQIDADKQVTTASATAQTEEPPLKLYPNTSSQLPPEPPMFFWFLWGIPPLLVFGLWAIRKPQARITHSTTNRKQIRRSQALQHLRNALKQAQQAEPKAAYAQIYNTILNYLSSTTGQPIEESNVASQIGPIPANLQPHLLQCLDEASSGQYAPITQADVHVLIKRTLQVCTAIERTLKS